MKPPSPSQRRIKKYHVKEEKKTCIQRCDWTLSRDPEVPPATGAEGTLPCIAGIADGWAAAQQSIPILRLVVGPGILTAPPDTDMTGIGWFIIEWGVFGPPLWELCVPLPFWDVSPVAKISYQGF